ncbi:MAG: hypothetical protein BWY37_02068 [Firmicutes bacterium ADurb.Bin262]|nr:MAG: hypothetical protein BWY37_02068 [Firmicutes bacterium ADurb.Bin262]
MAACTPSARALSATASASGCSEPASIEAAARSSSRGSTPGDGAMSVTTGLPSVTVPVLSSTTVSSACALSSASAEAMRMPLDAPFPVPTIRATGVAKPRAQGQEMTSTDIPMDRAKENGSPSSSQTAAATAAVTRTTGTKTALILSASFAMGALEELASSTSRTICDRVVSPPIFSAVNLNEPVLLTLPAKTRSPGCLSTGMLSPVSADSSTAEAPSAITPSTGMLWPGRITTTSPTATSSTGISACPPPRSTVAVLGARSRSFAMACVVLLFERASRYLPRVMSVRIVAADSKYRSAR